MALRSWTARLAAGALAAAALATSSHAATYVFLVHVTDASSSVGGPAFRPTSFVQTWTLDPQASGTSVDGPGISLRVERANAPTTHTSSPFDSLVRAISGLTLPDAGFSALKSRSSGFGAPDRSSYDVDFSATASKTTNTGPLHLLQNSSFSMSAMGTPPNNFDSLDQYGVRDLLRYAGALSWELEGEEQAFQGETLLFENHLAYRGFARLVGFEPTPVIAPPSAVPEPATWALLLAGFGLAGAHLRRRRAPVRPAHRAPWAGRVAAGALTAAALATSSQAATYTFNVHVTQGPTSIVRPTFTPLDFIQTWTLDPTPQSQAFSIGGLTVRTEFATAFATWSPTPFDPRLQGLTGLTLPDADFTASKYRNSVSGGAPADGYQIRFAASASDTLDFGVLRFEKERSIQMTAFGGPHNNFDPLDAFGLRDLLLYAGPLQWKQEGWSQTFLNGTPSPGFDNHLTYRGVATLIGFEPTPPIVPPPSAVPEPATWALLLSGFGLAGAHLRRRRATAS